jgi:hypothetical protein
MRRVVTGQDAAGRSVFVSDTEVEPVRLSLLPGAEFHRLWGSDTPPVLPADGLAAVPDGYFPPPGGYRFGFFTLTPSSMTLPEGLDIRAALAEFRTKLPGLPEVIEVEDAGMHQTDTVDLALVVSGECWLQLDDGEEVHLEAGNSVVQNGTRHAWHNRGTAPCVIFVAAVGAGRR